MLEVQTELPGYRIFVQATFNLFLCKSLQKSCPCRRGRPLQISRKSTQKRDQVLKDQAKLKNLTADCRSFILRLFVLILQLNT